MLKRISLFLSLVLLASIALVAQVQLEWTATEGVEYTSSTEMLTKTAVDGWNNAGARSLNRLDGNENGIIKYTIDNLSGQKAIGLSTKNNNHKVKSLDYAIVFNGNKLMIYEKGKFRGKYGKFKVGDEFSIERKESKIIFRKNGRQFRKRPTNPNHRLFADVAIYSNGASISGLTASFYKPIKISYTKQDISCDAGTDGTIDITVTGGKTPYTYLWSNGATTEDLTGLDIGKFTVVVTDDLGKQRKKNIRILSEVVWTDLEGSFSNIIGGEVGEIIIAPLPVGEEGPRYVKDLVKEEKATPQLVERFKEGAAASLNRLDAYQNGMVSYEIEDLSYTRVIGLAHKNYIGKSYFTTDYAMFLSKKEIISIFENGKYIGDFAKYTVGDKIKIQRKGSVIYYKINKEIIRKVETDPSKSLIVDVALLEGGAKFSNVKTNFCNITTISINTVPLTGNIPYLLQFQGNKYENTTGGIEFIYAPVSQTTYTGNITVTATADYDALELLFDFTNDEINNLRVVLSDSIPADTLGLDNNYYKVVDGHNLILYQGDTNDLPTDSLLFGLILEGGLGFSPNGDNSYDVLAVSGLENITQFDLTITDLTENIVFTTTDKSNFWNGKYMGDGNLVPNGAYNYSVQINGETFNGQFLVQY